MPKKNIKESVEILENALVRRVRPSVPMTFETVDDTIITEPGKSQSVQKLYQDFVLGRLDPSQIGGAPCYDPEDSDDVDPFNSFGMTLEDADALRQKSESEVRNANRKRHEKTVANASAAAKQPEQAKDVTQGDEHK